MILDKKHCKKIKYFSNMSNSMIFGGHFVNMQTRSLRLHFSACQHWFPDSAYPITPNQSVKPFLHKMPVLVNFSDFFPDYCCFSELLPFANFGIENL